MQLLIDTSLPPLHVLLMPMAGEKALVNNTVARTTRTDRRELVRAMVIASKGNCSV
jgi:hypothetical protein